MLIKKFKDADNQLNIVISESFGSISEHCLKNLSHENAYKTFNFMFRTLVNNFSSGNKNF